MPHNQNEDGSRGGSGRNLSGSAAKRSLQRYGGLCCAVILDFRTISALWVNHPDLESTSISSTHGAGAQFIIQMSWELGQPARDPYQSYTPFSYCFFVTSWKSRRGFSAFGSALTSFSGSPPSVCSKHSRLLFGRWVDGLHRFQGGSRYREAFPANSSTPHLRASNPTAEVSKLSSSWMITGEVAHGIEVCGRK
ncbi:hypothetical protein ACOSP7_020962 [Xanthoceras sorbifolium]